MTDVVCPRCASESVGSVEVQGVYDGVLFWVCDSGHAFHRFAPGTWQHDAASVYVDHQNAKRTQENPTPMTTPPSGLPERAKNAMRAGAVLSPCRTYRYSLWREWDAALPTFVVIGLNPSTADETQDDPTIRRCIGFSKREGCGKLVMLNLFAFRATRPADCFAAIDPVGPENDAMLRDYATEPRTKFAVAAWGAWGKPDRVADVAALFDTLWCFGRTQSGQPKHPLYLHASTPLEHYRGYRA